MYDKMNNQNPVLYSIGYSCHTIDSFIETLKHNEVTAIADVRSQPYSKFRPEFNKENISKNLKENGIVYVFLGENLGARIDAPECYVNGKADYKLIARHPKFIQGLDRIKKGIKNYNIALMCAEKDPITCHRSILIFRNLRNSKIKLFHILCDGSLENNIESENRLLKKFKLDQLDIFSDNSNIFEQAYEKQAQKIAYKIDQYIENKEVSQ